MGKRKTSHRSKPGHRAHTKFSHNIIVKGTLSAKPDVRLFADALILLAQEQLEAEEASRRERLS